ncbi:MAG: class I adenylate-forming enzyme family protein [Rhizomicrobium sp.]
MTLHATLQKNAAEFPDRPWLKFEGAQWTYAEADAHTDRIAAGLMRIGIKPGDRVALLFTNCPQIAFCYFACFKIGAIAVPINTRFQTAELVYALQHSQAKILIGQPDLCAALLPLRAVLSGLSHIFIAGEPLAGTLPFTDLSGAPDAILPDVDDDQLAVLLYTSGTTARPKGVMHTHASLLRQNANYLAALGAEVHAQTVILLPLCHIAGFSIFFLAATEAGGTLWLLPRFDPAAALRTLAQSRATYSGGLPLHINMLVNCPGAGEHDLSALQLFVGGGDCVPLELQNKFKALFGTKIDELCGMTEIIYTMQPHLAGEHRPGSIGKPIGDVRIRLVDTDGREALPGAVGEIVVHSGGVTKGYWNDPQSTQAALRDGGMHTGDLAHRDTDGFYWFAGRSKDIIIRGGSNISPGEVEDVLYAHPFVYEAGVVGAPDAQWGQTVRAYVVLHPGREASEADLQDWIAKSLAAYKVPERIVFADALPKGPTGKILRKALRERAAGEAASAPG